MLRALADSSAALCRGRLPAGPWRSPFRAFCMPGHPHTALAASAPALMYDCRMTRRGVVAESAAGDLSKKLMRSRTCSTILFGTKRTTVKRSVHSLE